MSSMSQRKVILSHLQKQDRNFEKISVNLVRILTGLLFKNILKVRFFLKFPERRQFLDGLSNDHIDKRFSFRL